MVLMRTRLCDASPRDEELLATSCRVPLAEFLLQLLVAA